MNKLIRNLIFIGLSAIVILYIINAFYDAFTREPIKNTKSNEENVTQDENNNSDQSKNKSSGKIIGNELGSSNNERLVENELTTDPSDNTFVDDDNSEKSDFDDSSQEDSDTQSDNESSDTAIDEDAGSLSESDKEEDEVLSTNQGKTLRDNPHLKEALPEVPQAPENRSSDEDKEDSSSNQNFPDPVQESNDSTNQFPNPMEDSSDSQGSNSQFPSPNQSTSDEEQSSNTFPDPL